MHLSKLPDTDRFSGTVRALSSPEPVMLHKRAKQIRSVGGVSHASGLVYHSPQKRNHLRSIKICIPFPTTMPALEFLPTAIGLCRVRMNVQASVASLTTVAGIHQHHSNSCLHRFVANEATQ